MPEMTPLEAAKNLEYIDKAVLIKGIGRQYDNLRASVTVAASYLRKIASGEYAPVVHGRWIESDTGWYHCSNCGDSCGALGDETPYKSERCQLCGAVMDKVVSE
ncbi:hypothetical protein [Faecalispora jeddahensis]|uniref:hypothetical protein n=1 Tax=Faecalispora jeddahensis TaxID=1414721 RepID=UPI00189ACF0D|nr:hypothetical protein [Faecalispora jeddahensis]